MSARWYSHIPEYTEISDKEKAIRDRIISIIHGYTREMEGYSYFGSNKGVSVEDYEDIADEIMFEFGIK
jgi:hypothetical protein